MCKEITMERVAIFLLVCLIVIPKQHGAASINLKRLERLEKMMDNLDKDMIDMQLKDDALQAQISNLTLHVQGRTGEGEGDGMGRSESSKGELKTVLAENERLKLDIKRLTNGLQTEKRLRQKHQRDTQRLVSTLTYRLDKAIEETVNQIEATNATVMLAVSEASSHCQVEQSDTMAENFTLRINQLERGVCLYRRACSQWSAWSECSASCGTGTQNRSCEEESLPVCGNGSTAETDQKSCEATSICCPSSFDIVDGQYCFMATSVIPKTRISRSEFCRSQGGHLPSIDSAEKQASFLKYIRQNFGYSAYVSIGGRRVAGAWVDRHGAPLQYSNWWHGDSGRSACINMYTYTGEWRSWPCTLSISFYTVCESE